MKIFPQFNSAENNQEKSADKLHKVFLLLIFALAWMASHPYNGIWHDGALYLAQAFLKINPATFQNDVFFKFGSQDSYSIFSPFYVFFIKLMGVETAALVLLLASQLFFIYALWLLCTEIFGRVIGVWAACGLAILSPYYGSENIFSYAEMFFTARNIAEPLSIFAIYFLLRKQLWLSAGILLLAGAFHPLITLPAMCMWWVYQAFDNKKYWYLILFLPFILLLAVSNIQPFHKILETYDSAWWDVVSIRNKYVLPLEWPLLSWVSFGVDCGCVYLATRVLQGPARRLMQATLLTTFLFTIIAVIGTAFLKNVLLTSLQLWRVDWLSHCFAMAVVPYFIIILWRKGGLAIYSAVFLVLSGFLYPTLPFLAFVALAGILYLLHRRGITYDSLNQRIRLYLNLGIGLTLLCIIIKVISDIYTLTSIPSLSNFSDREKIELTVYNADIWKLELIAAWSLFFIFKKRAHAIAFLLICMIPLGYYWDQRSAWQKNITAEQSRPHPFAPYLAEHHEVYWHGNSILATWSMLQATSYYSKAQGAGALFNRGTALELFKRAKALGQHQPECFSIQYNGSARDFKCQPDQAMIRKVCSKEQHLDGLIFPYEIKGLQPVRWVFKPLGGTQDTMYYLYPCSTIRKLGI